MKNNINKNKNEFKKACIFSLVLLLVLGVAYITLEPSLTKASATASDAVNVNLTVDPTIGLNSPTDVTMAPNITGTGSSTGQTTWTVTTNSNTGWKLEVNASTTPALTSGANDFANYTEGSTGTPEAWSIAAADSEFGFGATGTYIETKFGAAKYMGFSTTDKEQVAHSNSYSASGQDTTVIFKAEVGASKSQPTGSYQAVITATATSLP
jgi:hypothetical protein